MTQDEKAALLALAEAAAHTAGAALLDFYGTDLAVVTKADGSPLTVADKTSHRIVMDMLADSGIMVVSEEGDDLNPGATRYWLVDPLDGTKDFLASNGEFTVNIGLVEGHRPVLGVVYAPALGELYAGIVGESAWRTAGPTRTGCSTHLKSATLRMAKSRFHDHPDAAIFAQENGVVEQISIGAALKYGRLAMAEVDVYPRLVGTSEWDTAAGQAVLEAAGGAILDWDSGAPLQYGKRGRRNGKFIAFRHPYTSNDFRR